MPRRLFWMTILADVLIWVSACSLVVFVVSGPWHWSIFWWAMALTAAALLVHGAVPWWATRRGRREGGELAERVRAKRLWWLSQRLSLLTFGLWFGIVAGATGQGFIVVAFGVAMLVFLVIAPAVLVPVRLARVRRTTRPAG